MANTPAVPGSRVSAATDSRTSSPVASAAAPTRSRPSCEPLLDFERLDCYRVALEFQQLLPRLLPRRGQASLRDQLERASSSVLLNLAEGCGRFARLEKSHFYLIARGSTMECAAVLDVLLSRGLIASALHRHGRGLLVRVTQMLTRLVQRMQA